MRFPSSFRGWCSAALSVRALLGRVQNGLKIHNQKSDMCGGGWLVADQNGRMHSQWRWKSEKNGRHSSLHKIIGCALDHGWGRDLAARARSPPTPLTTKIVWNSILGRALEGEFANAATGSDAIAWGVPSACARAGVSWWRAGWWRPRLR